MSLIQKAKNELAEKKKREDEERDTQHKAYVCRRNEAAVILEKNLASLGCGDGFSYTLDHNHFTMTKDGVAVARGWITYEESRDSDGEGYSWGNGHFYLNENYYLVDDKDQVLKGCCSIESFATALVERFDL